MQREPPRAKSIERGVDLYFSERIEMVKRHLDFMSGNIETTERALNTLVALGTVPDPSVEHRFRNDLVKWKKIVEYSAKRQAELERLQKQWRENRNPSSMAEALHLMKRMREEEDSWMQAWERGQIAPPPLEVKK
jgi:hypothetical protein